MADIVLTGVYNAAQRAFRTEGSGSQRFEQDFVDAARRTCSRINRQADLEDEITLPVRTGNTLTNLDEDYEDVLFDGITYYLMKAGQKPARGFERQITHVEQAFIEGIQGIQDDIRNEATEDDSDDDTTDTIGIGKLG